MDYFRNRMDSAVEVARAKIFNDKSIYFPKDDFAAKKFTRSNPEPIFIGTTEGIGTKRCRANHIDSLVHYYEEQEQLKKAGAPI